MSCAFSTLLVALEHNAVDDRALCSGNARGSPGPACCAKARLSGGHSCHQRADRRQRRWLAGFFRRVVVVDIINWPVSLSSVLSGSPRRLETNAANLIGAVRLYKLSPSLQTADSTTRVAILNGRGVRVTYPCAMKLRAKVNEVIPSGEKHQHRHQRKADPEADFLGFFAQRTAANSLNGIEKQVAAIEQRNGKKVNQTDRNRQNADQVRRGCQTPPTRNLSRKPAQSGSGPESWSADSLPDDEAADDSSWSGRRGTRFPPRPPSARPRGV